MTSDRKLKASREGSKWRNYRWLRLGSEQDLAKQENHVLKEENRLAKDPAKDANLDLIFRKTTDNMILIFRDLENRQHDSHLSKDNMMKI